MHFLKIVDYGEYPHSKGLQRVSPEVGQRLERHFNSLRGRLARRFGGLPVYVGHPDDPDFSRQPGHSDTRAHGWVQGIEARADGLYGSVKWSASGRDLIENAHYKFLSPRWAMKHVGDEIYEPVRLLSIGLTNTPNIPGEAIANQAAPDTAEAEVGASPAQPPAPPVEPADPVPTPAVANQEFLTRVPRSADLGNRRDSFSRRTAIVDAVNARMAETGEVYTSAWSNLKHSRPDLF